MQSAGLNAIPDELLEMVGEVDTEDNGLMDFPEFVACLCRHSIRADEVAIDEIFKIFSDDEDRLIDAKSLANVLNEIGEIGEDHRPNFTEDDLQKLIANARLHLNENRNGDAAISKEGAHSLRNL
jgi:Ca2+-binding EF-hand superfamily protein